MFKNKYNQRGFTLLEMLIALTVTAIIGLAVGRVIVQVISVNAQSNTHEIAIKQVENAVHIISRDALQTQQFIPLNNSGIPKTADISKAIAFDLAAGDKLKLVWTAWDNTQTITIYDLQNGKLHKNTSVNGGQPVVAEVATSISLASGAWHTDVKNLDFSITAVVTGYKPSTEIRTFQLAPSPSQ